MKYLVYILLDNGDEIHAATEAKNQAEAIEKVSALQQVIDFKKSASVQNIEVLPDTTADDPSEFLLQLSETPGWWVLTDTVNLAVLRFKQGDFNGTQKITYLNEVEQYPDAALKLARINRKMADWLLAYHKELL